MPHLLDAQAWKSAETAYLDEWCKQKCSVYLGPIYTGHFSAAAKRSSKTLLWIPIEFNGQTHTTSAGDRCSLQTANVFIAL